MHLQNKNINRSGAVSFRRKRTKTAEALSKNSASAVLLCNLKEFKVENPWFSSFLLKFLFYRRLLNSRRTLVRLTLCEEIRFAYRRHSAAKSKICLAEQSSLAPL